MKVLLQSTEKYDLYHHHGMTKYTGCQCFKDCSCPDTFIPKPYDYYTVRKKVNKYKTTNHNTLEECQQRIDLIESIPVTKILENY